MENSLEFSISVFKKDFANLTHLLKLGKNIYQLCNMLQPKLDSLEKSLDLLNGRTVENYDPQYAIIVLRSNITWLTRQNSQDILEEIETVTKILQNGKNTVLGQTKE
jgi:hypothetical protein